MRKFITESGVHLKNKNTTKKIMFHLSIILFAILIFSFIKNGIIPFYNKEANIYTLFKPILMVLLGGLTSVFVEFIYFKLKKEKEIKEELINSYAFLPGVFLGLILPIQIPIYLVILGALVGSLFGKIIFGGLGKNFVNPALLGYLFLFLLFPINFSANNYFNEFEIESISSATPLTEISIQNYNVELNEFFNSYNGVLDYLFGFRPGAAAEVSIILLLIGFIYLIYFKVIKARIPIIYILTVAILNLLLVLFTGLDISLVLLSIISGGLLFGAIFMATDPVTSPVTKVGQILFAILLGILTFAFRFVFSYTEGVMLSILIMNLFVMPLDLLGLRYNFKKYGSIIVIALVSLIGLALTYYVSEIVEIATDDNVVGFEIISIENNNSLVYYTVTQKCFYIVKARVTLNSDGEVKEVIVLENHETFYDQVTENDYLEKIIDNQSNLDELDTITGATRTTDGLKTLVQNVINDFNKE